jgi:acylphosphatase
MVYDERVEGAAMICKKSLVGGRVQGVFYRATTAHRARELGITGYARNLPDGRVEVLAVGDAKSVEAFVEWLWTGSTASKVTSVETIDVTLSADQHPKAFTTG